MMKHGDLNKFIKYDTKVTNVTFDEEKKTFLVQTTSADNIGAPHQGRGLDCQIPGNTDGVKGSFDETSSSIKVSIFLATSSATKTEKKVALY